MTNDGAEPASPRTYKENDIDVNRPHPSTETPSLPSAGTLDVTRAPEPMSVSERHQIAIRHIHTVESHNARLYEDNCKLVNAVNMLNDRLTFFGAPQSAQLQCLADMQERLRSCEASRAMIHRKYEELLQCTPATAAQRHLHAELQAIREAYTALNKEFRLLMDNYTRLKAVPPVADPVSAPHVPRGLIPIARSEIANTQFHAQRRNGHASPTSAVSPRSLQYVDQTGNDRRRSSDDVAIQPSLRSGPSPIATSWLAHLPTPPPSAPLSMGQMSPTAFPVHAPVPAASLPLPHPSQIVSSDTRTLTGPPAASQSQHVAQQGLPEQLTTVLPLRRRGSESAATTNKDPVACNKETPVHLTLSAHPLKRPSTELQTPMSSGEEFKKPRILEEDKRLVAIDGHTHPTNEIPSSPVQRSYLDCVHLIFEKDGDLENGVFCGLCLDRFEAKMIPEPPEVLVRPDFDFLVRHCMTEHPTAWNDLRSNKA